MAVGFRLILLALDSEPRFFLGDSMSYLDTAFGRWIPPDRSWLYGLGVNALLRATHRLGAVIVVQSLASAALAVGAAAMLRALGVRRWLSWIVLLLLGADPMLLYYDRSIMTDAPAAAAVWLGIVFAVTATLRGEAWRWAGAIVCLWAAICLRTAVLPLVVLVSAWALLAGARFRREASGFRTPASRLAGPAWCAAAVGVGLVAYAVATGYVTGAGPSFNPKSGHILLGVMAPNLAPQDFAGLGVRDPARLLEETRHREYARRTDQIFLDDGLAQRLEDELGSWQRASSAGATAAWRSLVRDPWGFARLTATTAALYLTSRRYVTTFEGSFGLARPLPGALIASLREKVRDPVEPDSPARPSLVLTWLRRWAVAMPGVVWLALIVPVIPLVQARRAPGRTGGVLVLLSACTWTHALFTFAFSTSLSHRYLLIFSPLLLSTLALAAERRLGSRPRLCAAAYLDA